MTDVTTSQDQEPALSAADEQVLRELTERARAGGLKLTGEGGLLGRLTKMVVEGALEGELDDHLGYAKDDPAGRNGGNSRNGHRAKIVLTDAGPVQVSVPRDRDASFEPKIVAKRQRRLTGVDDMVISLSAKGLTHGEITAHLAEVYGAEVSKQTITAITDRVMEGMAEWQSRPLDRSGSVPDLLRPCMPGRGCRAPRTGESRAACGRRETDSRPLAPAPPRVSGGAGPARDSSAGAAPPELGRRAQA
jgi:putative transposase